MAFWNKKEEQRRRAHDEWMRHAMLALLSTTPPFSPEKFAENIKALVEDLQSLHLKMCNKD